LTHDDAKHGTCFRAMKSWKDIPKKKWFVIYLLCFGMHWMCIMLWILYWY
jgi:hypothetical protein